MTDENAESSMVKKFEELQRASGEIKCAECRHVFDEVEFFGLLQCPKCYKVFCGNCLTIHAFESGSQSRCVTCCK